jgi:hypothetical protein
MASLPTINSNGSNNVATRKWKQQLWVRSRSALRSLPVPSLLKWTLLGALLWRWPWLMTCVLATWYFAWYTCVEPAWRKTGLDPGSQRAGRAVGALRDCLRLADELNEERRQSDGAYELEREADEVLLAGARRSPLT